MRKKSNATTDAPKPGDAKGPSEDEFLRFLKDKNFIR